MKRDHEKDYNDNEEEYEIVEDDKKIKKSDKPLMDVKFLMFVRDKFPKLWDKYERYLVALSSAGNLEDLTAQEKKKIFTILLITSAIFLILFTVII